MINIVDESLRVVEGANPSATTSETGLNVVGANVGEKAYSAVFAVSAIAGTADASNNFSLQLEVSDALGGTYVALGNPVVPLVTGNYQIGFTSEQVENLVAGADFFRVTATKTGTTNTDITYDCYLTKGQ